MTNELRAQGYDISERTVRLYLLDSDQEGFTQNQGKRGRVITASGLAELKASYTIDRVGFLSAKIDQMICRMDFDLARRLGTVVINLSIVSPEQIWEHLDLIEQVFARGYAMGQLVTLLGPGESCSGTVVPEGMIGVATVCSITINGILLKYGIPMHSRFGGLLELRDEEAVRFAEIIMYDGTTIDPLQVFIRSAMTDYVGAVTTGNGRIGASFREIPSVSRKKVVDLREQLERIRLGGFMIIGVGSQPVLDIPVNEGRSGAIVIGGLNPMAILEERGVRVHSRALAGLLDFSRLFPYEELRERLREYR